MLLCYYLLKRMCNKCYFSNFCFGDCLTSQNYGAEHQKVMESNPATKMESNFTELVESNPTSKPPK